MEKDKKSKEVRKLTWRYFWRNKALEIGGIAGFIFLPYFIGLIPFIQNIFNFKSGSVDNLFQNDTISIWGIGLLILVAIIIVLAIIGAIIFSNWEKAEEQAERKLNPKKDKKEE